LVKIITTYLVLWDKSSGKNCAFSAIKKTAKNKQPNRRKFAQSGHPAVSRLQAIDSAVNETISDYVTRNGKPVFELRSFRREYAIEI
jgi:hypothetical protein